MTDAIRLTAALAGRYAIERELGHGGMATVYLARDMKHDREVALKVMLPELSAALGASAERFLREIRITARLDHPHILTLIDSGSDDGLLWYALPFVRGESLRQKLKREVQLAVDEALTITTQIASALEYAHRHGVIHRDIKPENILLHEGEAMLADFGIALAVQEAGGSRLTHSGFSPGTPQYMSPEQAAGDRAIDARTDVYSLAVVLYEMLTGSPPHTGPTVQAVVARLLTVEPTSLRMLRRSVSPGMDAAVTKALAKTPADRFSGAAEFAGALLDPEAGPRARWRRRLPVTAALAGVMALAGLAAVWHPWRWTPAAEHHSIAVLPFANFGGDTANEFFSDGITEDIIARLSQLEGIKVISRTSVMQYRGQTKPLRQIGAELGVTTVLEGSVRRAAGRVRVVAQLIDARTDEHLWAATYDRELRDVFAIQTDIADRIAAALGGTLGTGRTPAVATRPTEDLEAYDQYLRGRYFWNRRRETTLRQAIDYFQRAIARDSNFAAAYAGIADAYAVLPYYGAVSITEAEPLARRAAEKALALDPQLGEAHAALAYTLLLAWQWAESEREFQRALELNPGYATGHQWYGLLLSSVGRLDEANAEMRHALELDPLSLIINHNLCLNLLYRHRLDDALEQCRRTLELDPDFPFAHQTLWWIYQEQHRYREMEAEMERWAALRGVPLPAGAVLRNALTTGGAVGLYRALLTSPPDPTILATDRATWDLGVGDRDGAFRALEDGYTHHDPFMQNVNVFPALYPLHSDPRLVNLLTRMGLR